MKKYLYLIFGISLALAIPVHAQNSSLWKFVGNLRPVVSTWRIDGPGGISGSSLTVSGLQSCSGIQTNANGVTSCVSGSSGNWSGTGALYSAFSNIFVNQSGDTMTGGLTIQNGTSHTPTGTALLNVRGVASGTTLYATTALRSSGSLSVDGSMSGYSLTVSNLVSCENVQSSAAGALSCNATDYITETELDTVAELETQITDVDTFYTEDTTVPVVDGGTGFNSCTDGGFVTGNGTNALTCNAVLADDEIYVGDGTTEPTASAIVECLSTEKIQYTDSGNSFSCVADATGSTGAAQGLTVVGASLALSSSISGSLLEFTTVSGTTVYGQQSLRSSGSLVWEGAGSGNSLYIAGTITTNGMDCTGCISATDLADDALDFVDFQDTLDLDANLTLNSAGFTFTGNADGHAAGDFVWVGDTDASLFYADASADRVGIGIAAPKAKLSVNGTMSGVALFVQSGSNIINGRLGINKSTPRTAIEAVGTISGSVLVSTRRSPQPICITTASGSAVTVGSGTYFGTIPIPYIMSGATIKDVRATSRTLGGTQATKFKLYNHTKAKRQYLNTALQIDNGEYTSDTAATAYTFGSSLDVSGNDELIWYVPQVGSSPAPTGVSLCVVFAIP